LQFAARTVPFDGKKFLSTSIGHIKESQIQQDSLMEKENSEEKKDLQGQGSSSGSYSQTSHSMPESIEDIANTLNSLQVWKEVEKMVKLKSFKTLCQLVPSRDLFFSFLV